MVVQAESETDACAKTIAGMGISSYNAACEASTSASRRRLAQTASRYDVTVYVDPTAVNDAAFNAAIENLRRD